MTKRKKYSKEFKLDAISLVLEQGYTHIEAARSLEINAIILGRWIKGHQADDNGQAFLGNGKLRPEQEEIRQLKAHGFVDSMSRKGDCWYNAVVESFFGSLKQERVQWRNYQTR